MPPHDPRAYSASTYTTEHQQTVANPADSSSADASSSGLPRACMAFSMPLEDVGSQCDSVDMRASRISHCVISYSCLELIVMPSVSRWGLHFLLFLSHFEPLSFFRGTSPWSQGIYSSLPGTRLAFWSRGLGQHSRTASTLDKYSVDYVVYSRSHAFHDGNQTTKKNPNAFGIEPSTFPL